VPEIDFYQRPLLKRSATINMRGERLRREVSVKRTIDPRFEPNCEYAVIGRLLIRDPVWERRAEAQA
jgi:hypothetical protein